jgi:tRNA nucleotidyltransferase (CCA-adding enzyme)
LPDLLPDSIRAEVLERITPTKMELQNQKIVIDQLTKALIEHAKSGQFSYSFIEPQGSTGKKQTQLRGAADIDLFVGLKPADFQYLLAKIPADRHRGVDELMNSLVEDWFIPAVAHLDVERVQKAFSQHPFLSLSMRDIEVDILGCFDLDAATLAMEGPITAVDRTVHHSRFVSEHLTKKMREDARILKSFVRACHAYGDTCAVGRMGLTGVALELIVIATRGLDAALKCLEELDIKPLDSENRSIDKLKRTPAFRDDFIFLIDPTDTSRNVASSFTPRSYKWVQYKARRLRETLRSNDSNAILSELIESQIPTTDQPKQLLPHCYSCEFISNGQTHYTVLRDKIHRMLKKLQNELHSERTGEPRFGDSLAEVIFKDEHYAIGVIVEKPQISSTYIRQGPPIHLKEAVEEFRSAHKKVRAIEGHLCVEETRRWTNAQALIEKFIQENPIEGLSYIKDRTIFSKQVLNVLTKYVLPIELEFSQKIARVKDAE